MLQIYNKCLETQKSEWFSLSLLGATPLKNIAQMKEEHHALNKLS